MHDYLVHHGVKGQKWGVRRYQNPDGTLINKKSSESKASKDKNEYGVSRIIKRATKKSSELYQNLKDKHRVRRDRALAKKSQKAVQKQVNVKDISDADLRNIVNRLQLEKNYKQLMSELHPKKEHAVREMITDLAKTGFRDAGKALIDKFINDKIRNPNSKKKEAPNHSVADDYKDYNDEEMAAMTKRAQDELKYASAKKALGK